ncbi:hypothetical protein AVEN_199857-1 [Araneus ventricosus]|uniref:Uncharacterized protein n=1 Tax=Araneus ventricosus TaxID=182803 RepID=A0A4Y2DUC4_ARAVE|nr:hypothetical protein AVEN_199857-1 [Araneus ventricosus]
MKKKIHIEITFVWSIFRPMYLSDGRCYSWSIEDRDPTALTGQGRNASRRRHALSPTVGKPKPLLYPLGKREPAYLSSGFSTVYSRCPPRET